MTTRTCPLNVYVKRMRATIGITGRESVAARAASRLLCLDFPMR